MQLFDTRSGDLRPLITGHTVRLYVCGITPYDAAHLGHASTYVMFDVLIRLLEHRGHRVRYVRNVTDVDDDILRTARERDVDYRTLAERETAAFDRDLRALGCRAPDVAPRATETVPAIVTAVGGLLARGSAYALDDGRVYFDIASAHDFGRLSRLDRDRMLEQFAEKGGDPEASGKRDELDFLLWQPSGDGEPRWPSPWGDGRPGWHIECSVMAMEHLGGVIDIHGGGSDLVFPHHEAEIAQSEHLTGQGPFARFWLHTGMVGLDGEKMSKSVGNLVFARDLLDRFEGATIRAYVLAHHYRETWSHSDDDLQAACDRVKRWRAAATGDGSDATMEQTLLRCLDNDLDTPRALAALDRLADEGHGESVRRMATVLGLDLGNDLTA
ncbi:MAG: cysteine--tRNA ligase [Actinobacteria bacterium]|nr:cysteine--tRNA ligase [Actinomycetota bacterium]